MDTHIETGILRAVVIQRFITVDIRSEKSTYTQGKLLPYCVYSVILLILNVSLHALPVKLYFNFKS